MSNIDRSMVITSAQVEVEVQDALRTSVLSDRDKLLSETDWMALSDTKKMPSKWAKYRQALRDITVQKGFPENVEWPEKPKGE